jgi:hypothetical protein
MSSAKVCGVAITVAMALLGSPAAGAGTVPPPPRLLSTLVPTAAEQQFAVSGTTAVEGREVFVNPPSGVWSNPAPVATLVQADGSPFGTFNGIAASGNIIVATGSTTDAFGGIVFVRPPGGWSGASPARAWLHIPVSSDVAGATPVVSQNTIFIGASWTVSGRLNDAVFVYREPTGGWSGTLNPSAELIANAGPGMVPDGDQNLAAAGTNVYVAAPSPVTPPGRMINIFYYRYVPVAYVFSRPRGGWSGRISQSGTLNALRTSGPGNIVAASGSNVAVDSGPSPNPAHDRVVIYRRPARGWGKVSPPSGSFAFTPVSGDASGESIAISAHRIVALCSAESSSYGWLLTTPPTPHRARSL